jgi:hypothetical protein
MADEPRLKTAYELAMERLQKKDAEAGVTQRALTDEDRAAIADVRSLYESKIAEQHVMLQSKLAGAFDPSARESLEAEFRAEKERLSAERERKIERIRTGTP